MDFSKYEKPVRDLYNAYADSIRAYSDDALVILEKMRKIALSMGDPLLTGFTYHSQAYVEYFIKGRYEPYLKCLKLSVRYLLRAQDKGELSHVFYLIAIDATNKGMFDVACNYYIMARDLSNAEGEPSSTAILDASVAHVLLQLGAYKEGRAHLKKAAAVMRRKKQNPNYYGNVLYTYVDEGTACLKKAI